MGLGQGLHRCRSLGFLTRRIELHQLGTDIGSIELLRGGFDTAPGDHVGFYCTSKFIRGGLTIKWLLFPTKQISKPTRLCSLLDHLRGDLFVEFFIGRWLAVILLPDIEGGLDRTSQVIIIVFVRSG